VVDGIRLTPEERDRTPVLLLDSDRRIIASSDHQGVLSETQPLRTEGAQRGSYEDKSGNTVVLPLPPATRPIADWAGMAASYRGSTETAPNVPRRRLDDYRPRQP